MIILYAIWAFVMCMWINAEKANVYEIYSFYKENHNFLSMIFMLCIKTALDLLTLVSIGLVLCKFGIIK